MDKCSDYRYDAYCGLYCGSCEMLMGTKKNELENIAKLKNVSLDGVKCHGCKTDVLYEHCRNCQLKKCAQDKNIEFCIDCNEYPCQNLENFRNNPQYPYHIEVYESMEEIKQKGCKIWLENQKKRWSCQSCSQEYMWYTLKCEKCGKKVNGYNRPIKKS